MACVPPGPDICHKMPPQKLYGQPFMTSHTMPNFFPVQQTRRECSPPKRRRTEDYKVWFSVVQEDDHSLSIRSSDAIKGLESTLLENASTVLRSSGLVDDAAFYRQSSRQSSSYGNAPQSSTISYPRNNKRRRFDSDASESSHVDTSFKIPSETTSFQEVGVVATEESPRTEPATAILCGETKRWEKWLCEGFASIQQQACRIIAKEWIKAIHPRKQSTHPYNGNLPKNEKRDSERTKPPYWPPDIVHKEPDHIDKKARTTLLMHLLMGTPQPEIVADSVKSDKVFTAKDLLAVLDKKQDPHLLEKMDIVRKLIDVRVELENFEEGGYGPDASIHVYPWSTNVPHGNRAPKKHKEKSKERTKNRGGTTSGPKTSNDDNSADYSAFVTTPATSYESPQAEETDETDQEESDDLRTSQSFSTNASHDNVKAEQAPQYHKLQEDFQQLSHQPGNYDTSTLHDEQQATYVPQCLQPSTYRQRNSIAVGPQYAQSPWQVTDGHIPRYMGDYNDGVMMHQAQGSMMQQAKFDEILPYRSRDTMSDAMHIQAYHDSQGISYLSPDNMYLGQSTGNPHAAINHGYDAYQARQSDMKPVSEGPQTFYPM